MADVSRIARYIAFDNPTAAMRVAREILLAGDSLELFPNRGRTGRQSGTRELVATGPYILVCRVAEETVTILSVWHGAQDR